jgi:hypothetical protein
MDMQTVLTHGLTYLAALALPLWLLGEQLVGWWTLREPKADKVDKDEPKAHLEAEDEAETLRKAA